MNAIIRYYGDTKDVILPLNYLNFTRSLSEMLQNSDEYLSNVSVFYIKNKNKHFVKSSNDYSQLLEKLKNEEVRVIDIEIEIGDNKSKTKHEKKKDNVKNDEKDLMAGKIKSKSQMNDKKDEFHIQIEETKKYINSSYNALENKDINYNENCEICKSKIIETLFKCLECQNYFCEDCETKKGHKHPLLKIKTFEDYKKYKTILFKNLNNNLGMNSNYNRKSLYKDKNNLDYIENSKKNFDNKQFENNFKQPSSNIKRKDKDNNSYNELQKKERVVSDYKIELYKNLDDLIVEAKNNYDIKNIDDENLGNAIKNAKGNIDDAICNLFE